MKRIFLLLTIPIILSCNNQKVIIYTQDNTKNDDGEIFGSNLKAFFNDNSSNININSIRSNELSKKLLSIKEKIQIVNNNIEPDDSYYEYVFINKKDTLYADYRLEFWKYGNKGILYKLDDNTKKQIKNYQNKKSATQSR